MNFILYGADCTGDAGNCLYPHRLEITNPAELAAAVAKDHVAAKYKGSYRNTENFEEACLIEMDCDNDHSDNPGEWITPEMLAADPGLCDVQFATTPSRHNMLQKNGRSPRPRFHFHTPIHPSAGPEHVSNLKKALRKRYPFFDGNALDATRFMFGSAVTEKEVFWHEGSTTVDDMLLSGSAGSGKNNAGSDTIPEGSRNNTMSHFAGRVLKRLGVCDKALEAFRERAAKCQPPLPEEELENIWNSAVKFYEKISSLEGYVPPDEYNDEFGTGSLKPEDYSDMGEAKVLASVCGPRLKYTSATDFIAFHEDRWYEDKQKALGMVEGFMDTQLNDAAEAVCAAEEALVAIGIDGELVRNRGKELAEKVPDDKLSLLFALLDADAYKKFVMKYRNYKHMVDAQKAATPMLAIDVSELDYDAELLNTPDGTVDLTKGLSGMRPHDPDDLITKITACGPGDKGMQLWKDALQLFFCRDQGLIGYVQENIGMAAFGKVYAEHMIIAYGGGANGKSTFWNTVARVLGNYSGKISAEALTMNCKHNVKPEMAELKGKRLIIASELAEGTRLNTAMVKQLCSVDPIEAEKKFKDPFHFDPSHTLVLYTNHLPKVSANDDGTWRRLIVIPFNAKITGNSDIKNYGDYLFEHAGPAILSWIIEGAQKAAGKGFRIQIPKVVSDAVEAYREENDWLGKFLEDYCDIDPSYEEKSGDLYQAYRNECILTGEYIRSTTDFYGSLEKTGFNRHRKNSGKVVSGLRLKAGRDFLS